MQSSKIPSHTQLLTKLQVIIQECDVIAKEIDKPASKLGPNYDLADRVNQLFKLIRALNRDIVLTGLSGLSDNIGPSDVNELQNRSKKNWPLAVFSNELLYEPLNEKIKRIKQEALSRRTELDPAATNRNTHCILL